MSRRSTLVCLALLLIPNSALCDPASECEDWEVHGYWIGMSEEVAAAVRLMKETETGRWAVEEEGKFEGTLAFDEDGVRYYVVQLNTEASERDGLGQPIETELRRRFGEPHDPLRHRGWSAEWGDILMEATYWTSERCDTVIAVLTMTAVQTVRKPPPRLYLERLSEWRERTHSGADWLGLALR